jgi:hypothetical protein
LQIRGAGRLLVGQMKPETLVAIYAAIVGTGALLLNFKSWFDFGVKLKLSVILEGTILSADAAFNEEDLIILYVMNRGDASTKITSMIILNLFRGGNGDE